MVRVPEHFRIHGTPNLSDPMNALPSNRWMPLLVGGLSLVVAGCHESKPGVAASNLPPARVRLGEVRLAPYVAVEEVMGTVRARRKTVVEAKVTGRISALDVRLGQSVRAGDLLIQLDAPELVARVDQARVVLDQAGRERDRFQGLLQQRTVTAQEFELVDSRWRVAKAGMAEAETLLGYTRVTAAFDGVVSRKVAELGDLATPGRPLLELEVPGDLRLEADVGEALLSRIRTHQVLGVRLAGKPDLEGRVAEIAPSADAGTRTFLVKVDLPPLEGVHSGQFGRLGIPVAESSILSVPQAALIRRGQLEFVVVGVDGQAQLRLVRTGRALGDRVEILSGLEGGEKVVLEAPASVIEGQGLEVAP